MQEYIFDFDGTLADSGKTGILATQEAFKDFSLPIPTSETVNYYMGIPIEVSFKKMAPHHSFSQQEFEDLMECFRMYYKKNELTNVTLFHGILTTLETLVQQSKSLYVVSSKNSIALLRNLENLKIANYFTDIVGSDQVHHFKPAPDGVLSLIKKYRLDPNDCIMIGDAIFDLQMGKAAGVHTCGVTWGAHDAQNLMKEKPDFLLNTAEELLSI
ncbi:MAG: HAD-IA family hydrolase [Liquorilactobacillus hordei]|uniref:HAD family hydrolase n=1 Tax=Liquorilactobacillus hordei TaxID=468911 RepID=UPI0039E7F92F